MVFGPEPLRDRLDHMITLDGISLTSSLSVRNLGVTFDQNLFFNSHIKTVSRSAFFHLRNITKIRKLLTRHDAEKLVHAFVTSRLDYCNSLLSGCPNSSLRSLQLIQNAAARVLTGIDKRDHITPVLASLHWLPVKFRIIFKTLFLTYKVLRGLAPSYLEELVTPYQPNRPLRSQNAGLLVVPRVSRGRMGGRAFSYQAPLLWNQFPVQETDIIDMEGPKNLQHINQAFPSPSQPECSPSTYLQPRSFSVAGAMRRDLLRRQKWEIFTEPSDGAELCSCCTVTLLVNHCCSICSCTWELQYCRAQMQPSNMQN
ncbi:hypothetical protein D4764_07G0003640 [Takifugu flavidus]|uniref:Uncharacterized protein n=1 Tax=Takifugu flavidus TaxID=433684 RepID=A0A5C6MS53_9TELE|nr:hypothetical protein D4764_07G0003640 [Takifugu flavidus]